MKSTYLLAALLLLGVYKDAVTVKADVQIEEIDEQSPNQGADEEPL